MDEYRGGIAGCPDLRRARHVQVVLGLIALFTAMDIYVVSLMIEPIKHELGLTDVEVGLANTTMLYGSYALFCIPMGMLADRLSRVRKAYEIAPEKSDDFPESVRCR